MHNFVYHNPTKILFGRNTTTSIGTETKAWGTRGLLIYGRKSIKTSGLYDRVKMDLDQAGVHVTELGGVQSNPLLSLVRKGVQLAKQHDIDVIIAVGGGSVLDTAKAIAAGALVEHDVWKFFRGKKSIKQALPVTTILTLAASGSEMNSGMVITNDETQEKFGYGHRLLHPKTSILDPELTFTVPPDYTAYGAVDAISHLLEFYMTTREHNTSVQDRLMEGLIENTMSACESCLEDPSDYDGRSTLMWTATLALNGLASTGLGRVSFPMHLIEHSLSALYDIPHGAGLSVVIPAWLQYNAHSHPSRLAELCTRLFPLPGKSLAEDDILAQHAIEIFRSWFDRIGAPTTLEQLGIPEGNIQEIALNTQGLAKIWRLQNYTPEVVTEILHLCRE